MLPSSLCVQCIKGSKESLTSILSLLQRERRTEASRSLFVRRIVSCDSPLPVWGEDEGEGTFFWFSQVAVRRVIWFEWIESLESKPNTVVFSAKTSRTGILSFGRRRLKIICSAKPTPGR